MTSAAGASVRGLNAVRLQRLNRVLSAAWKHNPFYREKWLSSGLKPQPLKQFVDLFTYPLLTRSELVEDQKHFPYFGQNLTMPYGTGLYVTRSSGTTSQPLYWRDDHLSRVALVRQSRSLFQRAGLKRGDRVALFSSTGGSAPSWLLRDGLLSLGCSVSTLSRLNAEESSFLDFFQPRAWVGTLRSLLQFSEMIESQSTPKPVSPTAIISSGSPGLGECRDRLERLFGAPCLDRYGNTEAGSVATECPEQDGMHLAEEALLPECVDLETGIPVGDSLSGELVLTHLNRLSMPLIRYRTGDEVTLSRRSTCRCGCRGAMLIGGIKRQC